MLTDGADAEKLPIGYFERKNKNIVSIIIPEHWKTNQSA